MTLLAAVIHESGHVLCLNHLKRKKAKIRGVLSGLRLKIDPNTTYKEEILICGSGPMMNILVSIILGFSASVLGYNFALFSGVNLATALSNLLPIKGYDGYRIISACFEETNNHSMLRLLQKLSSLLIFTLCLFSLYFIDRYGTGYWIFAVFFISMIKSIDDDLS